MKKPVVLCIMDGFGIRESKDGNAILSANTPNLTKIFAENPFTTIAASGLDVGLPEGQMGNSEVGHTNIGAGRIVYQMLVKISKAIKDGEFFDIKCLKSAVENCKKNDSALHFIGLLSDGGVHSHNQHLYGLLKLAKDNGLLISGGSDFHGKAKPGLELGTGYGRLHVPQEVLDNLITKKNELFPE